MVDPEQNGQAVILVAEDQPVVRSVVVATLTRGGYAVLAAENGDEALQISRAHPGHIDLLLTDVVMPGLRGPEVAAILELERPGIRVLLMSGHTPDELPHESKTDLVLKPFLPRDLLARVRRELGR